MSGTSGASRVAGLDPHRGGGPLLGFANLFRHEARPWLRFRLGGVQALLWTGLLGGGLLLPLVALREVFAAETAGPLASAFEMFFTLGAVGPAIGAVILAHGAVIGERQSGTAAWVLTKPASRAAFVLAKFAAMALGMVATAVAVPGAVAYAALSAEAGAPLPVVPFLAGLGLLALHVVFYVALALALSVFARTRGAVLAVGLGAILAGDVLIGLVPALGEVGPWLLGRLALVAAQGGPLLTPWPPVAVALGTAALLTAAVVRFGREEL